MENSKILIVDDSAENIVYLKAVLKNEGYEFFEASNGKEGVDMAIEQIPDLILMDAIMPVMDGFDATECIRRAPETERIPVLMITALQDKTNMLRALACGVTDFISKPFDKMELLARCRSLVNASKLNQKYIFAASNPTTKLPNKTALAEEIPQLCAPKLFIIEIDEFEEYGDFYGYEESERMEIRFASTMKEIVREHCMHKWNIYHIGDGKFALLIDDVKNAINVEEGENICRKLETLIKAASIKSEEHTYPFNFTTGFAFEQNRLVERASLALIEAKKQKKDYIYDKHILDKVNFEIENNLFWVKKLQKSITNNKIVPFFQPILNNRTKTVEKYEALVRLIKSDGTIVTPIHFLEASKKARYYNKLTKIMLEKSIEIFAKIDAQVSVNISTLDIEDEGMHKYILETLRKNESITKKLVFEILESESIANTDMFSSFIQEVKLLGAKIALDDFGSGYSNFARLLSLDIDYLKIDGSLIVNTVKDKNYEDIVRMICEFASKRGMKTVAEFVKNREVFERVVELGIDYSQGYYISAPIQDIDGFTPPHL